jgi:hypothetical protein
MKYNQNHRELKHPKKEMGAVMIQGTKDVLSAVKS